MVDPLQEIDWNEAWKNQIKESRGSCPSRDCARIWESRESALRFWNMCRKERSRIDKTIWETELTEKSRVLDIGAGPGTLAIPLAQKAAHVTAVEPAEHVQCDAGEDGRIRDFQHKYSSKAMGRCGSREGP